MLNKKERHHVLTFLRHFCKVGVLPLQVKADCWEIEPGVKSSWEKLASRVSFGAFFVHTLYKNLSLLHTFVFAPDTPLHQMVIHMILAGTSAMMVLWYHVMYIQYPGTYATFAGMTLNATVTGKVEDAPSLDETKGKRWIRELMERSLQDLIAISLPYMVTPGVPIISASFVYGPTIKLLLYAMLPENWKNWLWFWACFTAEIHFLVIFTAIATPPWQLQVIYFELVNKNLQTMASAVTKSRPPSVGQVEEGYKSLRCLQLYVRIVNIINRNLIFTWKLVSLGITIVSGYAAIAHFKEHPIFGMMYYVIFFDVTLAYTLLYEKAFKTPDLFRQAVNAEIIKVGTGTYREMWTPAKKKILARQLRSIPSMGIKVGQFHTLERTSTSVFLEKML